MDIPTKFVTNSQQVLILVDNREARSKVPRLIKKHDDITCIKLEPNSSLEIDSCKIIAPCADLCIECVKKLMKQINFKDKIYGLN